ncbi:sigma-54-dependent Fis family transcriptional regulator [Planococcus sp. 4-30]|uniref:sigma-54-dependent Fis family transcriptional regulator n=1 Tax=Planococcus sp. 4-30 TaxID=2874583 RepID=UPI001CBDD693|nr:sigma-54-dependent Fis family transcriptional regulator [Planococcus sp. 4-30]
MAWTNHVKWNTPEGEVREVIAESWSRSKEYGVNPDLLAAPVICTEKAIESKIRKNIELLNLIRPLLDDLFAVVRGSDSIIAFSDKEGVILELFGDSEIAMNAASANFKVGAKMSERHSGSNAIGTAIAIGGPIQMVGAEHYCVAWHTSHCSSAPIRDPLSSEIIGIITVVGYLNTAHPHSLALVKAAAEAIMKLIEQKELEQEKYMSNHYFNAALESVSDGIVIVNLHGEILRMNKIAAHLLHLPGSNFEKLKINEIEKLKSFSTDLTETINEHEVILKGESSVESGGGTQFFLTSRKIGIEKEHIGNILILKRKVSKELMNSTAIHQFSSLVGEEESFRKTVDYARKAAKTDKNVLLIGESGTGKELFAQAIHNDSSRQRGPFLAINCASIPQELIASELFGYVDGAFTNAARGGKKGKFEAAHGGTLLLDEIGDMPLDLQANLLRVLEEREITPLGSNRSKSVDVRIIAATNQDLLSLVKEKKFRLDLFYRLNILTLEIPPLRKRKSDLPLLVDYFSRTKKLAPEAVNAFMAYEWPGNLRELKNVLEQMEVFCDEDILTSEYLPAYLAKETPPQENPELYKKMEKETKAQMLKAVLRNSEKIEQAAKTLGVSVSTVYRWAGEQNISVKESFKK